MFATSSSATNEAFEIGSSSRSTISLSHHQRGMLATKIIRYKYGPTPERVCEVLLSKGSLPLRDIVSESQQPLNEVRNALTLLVHMQYVTCTNSTNKAVETKLYSFNIEQTLLVLRFPAYLLHIREEMGDAAENILLLLMESGPLTFETLFDFLQRRGDGAGVTREHYFKTLARMFSSGYVKRCPVIQTVAEAPPPSEGAKSKGKGKRKQPEATTSFDDDDYDTSAPSKRGGGLQASSAVAFGSVDDIKEIPFTVNPQGFLWDFRCKIVLEYVSDRYGHQAGEAIRCLLTIVRNEYVSQRIEYTKRREVPLPTLETRIRELAAQRNVAGLNEGHNLRHSLDLVVADPAQILTRTIAGTSIAYSFGLGTALNILQQRQVETIIETKFGTEGRRILRLLLEKKNLEATSMWDIAMVAPKDAQRLLYNMHLAGYLHLQEVSRSYDAAANRKYFLWSVDFKHLCQILTDEIYKTAGHLLSRIDAEKNKLHNILGQGGEVSALMKEQKAQYDTTNRGIQQLEASLCRLDETISLFQDIFTRD